VVELSYQIVPGKESLIRIFWLLRIKAPKTKLTLTAASIPSLHQPLGGVS
jgi:hypothetical protein